MSTHEAWRDQARDAGRFGHRLHPEAEVDLDATTAQVNQWEDVIGESNERADEMVASSKVLNITPLPGRLSDPDFHLGPDGVGRLLVGFTSDRGDHVPLIVRVDADSASLDADSAERLRGAESDEHIAGVVISQTQAAARIARAAALGDPDTQETTAHLRRTSMSTVEVDGERERLANSLRVDRKKPASPPRIVQTYRGKTGGACKVVFSVGNGHVATVETTPDGNSLTTVRHSRFGPMVPEAVSDPEVEKNLTSFRAWAKKRRKELTALAEAADDGVGVQWENFQR